MSTISDREVIFSKTIRIDRSVSEVWAALTIPALMKQWMSPENPIDVIADWQIGHPFLIRGHHYKMPFENRGLVLQFEPLATLAYSHLSSISRLADVREHYSIFEFRLAVFGGHTSLTFTASNFATETIYKHLAFYWNVTLEVLKKFVEGFEFHQVYLER